MLTLRPFQTEAIQHLNIPFSQSLHLICVSATGSGKSLIYERIAAAPQRRVLLITPLVALARQQHQKLKLQKIPVALGAGNASQGPPTGQTGAWIISPETLHFTTRQNQLRSWKPNLLVVDECHCLWDWGERFRPAFTLIPRLLIEYNILHSLWLTATLPPEARQQLRKLLPQPRIEMGQFQLPERLILQIQRTAWKDRTERLLTWLHKQKEAGIVFVSTREATLRLARLIQATGRKTVAYHAGLSWEERRNIETAIQEQHFDVIVATSAFGMGMDYPHLNFCILWQAPPSILALVQIIGRVGRGSGKMGQALVFWDLEDFRLLEWTVQNSSTRKAELHALLTFLNRSQCRRSSLSEYFDPETQAYCCQFCDFCIGI